MRNFIFILTLLLLAGCASDKLKYNHPLPEGKVKFCFIGDSGFGSKQQAQVAKALVKEGCHSVHHVGDIIYPDGFSSIDDPLFENNFMRFYQPVMEGPNKPHFYLIMGNHDYQGDVKVWKKISKQYPQIFFPDPYYFVDMQGICFVHLDTNLLKYGVYFIQAIKQMAWLSGLEDELKNCQTTVALTHHPYQSRGHHGKATGTVKWFLSSRIIGKFDYLISGHDHILSDEGREEGTHMLISGAAGDVDSGEDIGFIILEAQVENGKAKSVGPHFIRKVPSSHQTSSP